MQRPRNAVAAQAVQQGYLAIKSVIQRSGAHRQTIHYYLHKGLLPLPARTSRTSALYPPSTVELIQLVREFQRRHRLTLDEIAEVFQRHSYDPCSIRSDLESLGPAVASGDHFVTAPELLAALRPPPPETWLEEVLEAGLIQPFMRDGEESFSPLACQVIRALWEGVRLGIPLDQFRRLNTLIRDQAGQEVGELRELLREIPLGEDAYRQVAGLFAVVERFGSLQRKAALHEGFILSAKESMYLFVGPNRKYVFPSETFLARMGLNREIDRLLVHLDRHPGDLSALRDLARAYHLRSDWVHLHETAEQVLGLAPDDEAAMAYQGQALTYLGRHDEAVAALEQSLGKTANALIKLRLGEALVIRAKRTGDPSKLLEAIAGKARLSSEAVREARGQPALYRKVRLNLLLDNISLSDPLCLRGPSVEELEQLYGEFNSLKERGMTVLGKVSLAMAKMFVCYALYVIRQKEGHRDAARLRREILAIDPDGLLAARSTRAAGKVRPTKKRRAGTAA